MSQKLNNVPERVQLWRWLLSIALFPVGLLPAILMEPEQYSVFLGRFQFVTTYPFILALAFNALRRRDANLFQGSLTFRASSEGVSRWKLLVGTLFWDTPLMVCLALFIARGNGADDQAVLIVQALSCTYIEAVAGLLFPTLDAAVILVNFAPYLAVANITSPLVGGLAEVINLTFSGDWLWACLPPVLFGLAGFRLWLGAFGRGRWVVPGISGFLFALIVSVLETQFIQALPAVSYEQGVLLKTCMTVTTCLMILNYRYLTNKVVIVRGQDLRRVHIWVLTSLYATFSISVLSLLRFWRLGFWDGAAFVQDLVIMHAACLACLALSTILTKVSDEVWAKFYSRTEALVDDGLSAVVSKLIILSLQRFLR